METVTIQCPCCQGEGVVSDPLTDGFLDTDCPTCDGEGWLDVDIEYDFEQ